MKILVEILKNNKTGIGDSWIVEKSKTITIDTKINMTTRKRAKDKLLQLKSTLAPDEKIRILEYHNDDFGDKNRKSCKILFE